MMVAETLKKQMVIPDSQEKEENDIKAMHMSDDSASNTDVDEKVFKGSIQIFQQELDTSSPEQVEAIINAAFEVQVIVSIMEKTDA
jgi:hypothetical protein